MTASSSPPARAGRGAARATAGTSRKVLGALGSLVFVLVVNFFLFRVLPGTRRGRWAATG